MMSLSDSVPVAGAGCHGAAGQSRCRPDSGLSCATVTARAVNLNHHDVRVIMMQIVIMIPWPLET